MPNNHGTMNQTNITITTQLNKFNQNPVVAISRMDTLSVPNTIAFGGVPTGNINAQFAAIAAGIISASGCMCIPTAIVAKIGNIIVAVAVFDVISVKNSTNSVTIKIIKMMLIPSRLDICLPMVSLLQ